MNKKLNNQNTEITKKKPSFQKKVNLS